MDLKLISQLLLVVIVVVPMGFVLANRLRMDVAALIICALLGSAHLLGLQMLDQSGEAASASKALSGFSQPVVVTLIALFIVTRAMEKTGITRWIARRVVTLGGSSESRLIALFVATTAGLSLIMNNLAAGALILPSAMEVARRTGIKPSKLLIPVAYGSLLGGSATYFTTANIIVSDLLPIASPPQSPLRISDFTPAGGLILLAGFLFLVLFGKRLLPDRPPSIEQMMTRLTGSELEDVYRIGERMWETRVRQGSALAGKTLREADIGRRYGLEVIAVWHGRQAIFPPSAEQVIYPHDILLIVGREDRVKLLGEEGLIIHREKTNGHISPYGVTLLEVMLSPRSKSVGQTLKEINFRRRYGFTAVAIRRLDSSYRTNVGDIELSLGDSILLLGPPERVRFLQNDPDFIVLQPSIQDQPVDRRSAAITIGVVGAAVIASILGVPVYLAMLVAALVVLVLGILNMEDAYRSIEWQALFVIAGMYTVSLAMVETGLADLLGEVMTRMAGPFGAIGLAAGGFLLSGLLTQVMGGQVTALVTGPVAISAAISMGVNPQAIAVATALGCSAFFLTPFAHPVNIMIIAPANYTFRDFIHIGWRLTVVSFVMLLLGMWLFWGL